jgi:hypothetical protein
LIPFNGAAPMGHEVGVSSHDCCDVIVPARQRVVMLLLTNRYKLEHIMKHSPPDVNVAGQLPKFPLAGAVRLHEFGLQRCTAENVPPVVSHAVVADEAV